MSDAIILRPRNWSPAPNPDGIYVGWYTSVVIAGRVWTFNIQNMSAEDVSVLKGSRTPCEGCNVLPDNGTRTNKFHWCELSHAVAAQQEKEFMDRDCIDADGVEDD